VSSLQSGKTLLQRAGPLDAVQSTHGPQLGAGGSKTDVGPGLSHGQLQRLSGQVRGLGDRFVELCISWTQQRGGDKLDESCEVFSVLMPSCTYYAFIMFLNLTVLK